MAETREVQHGASCACSRCQGFQRGHELSLRHGAYVGVLQLAPDAEPIAERLRGLVHEKLDHPMFVAMIETAAIAGARLQRAEKALAETADPARLARLEQDSRSWWKSWFAALGALGLRPDTAVSIGLNLTLTESARAEMARRYRDGAS